MSKSIVIPDLGEGVTEGEVVRFLVKPGDTIQIDQVVVEVMTDKATMEVTATCNGVVESLKVSEGDIVPIGQVAMTVTVGETAQKGQSKKTSPKKNVVESEPQKSASNLVQEKISKEPQSLVNQQQQSTLPSPTLPSSLSSPVQPAGIFPPLVSGHVKAAPSTRQLAREYKVDINRIAGTGPAGRVTRTDVVNSLQQPMLQNQPLLSLQDPVVFQESFFSKSKGLSDAKEGFKKTPLRGIRRKIAEKLQKTKRTVPHFTLMDEVSVLDLFHIRQELKEFSQKHYGVKVTYLPFIIKALVAAVKEFPIFNVSLDDEAQEIVYKEHFHIGVATDTPQGLLVPVIRHADHKNLIELSTEIVELSEKANRGKLSRDEMMGAGVTITNIGSVGGSYATPIINHPEVAILGVYKMFDKVSVKNGQMVLDKAMNYTITCDHRLIDGAVAAKFLKTFLEYIKNPLSLLPQEAQVGKK